ncbi:hypothetical protein [Brevibacillus brevis]|uniref:hypothetical protein n=1 Tax=Brevibacillus brevis TaxID=1393 RepID=UPI00165D349F|nr:hypothetical protein [Brevibacillus brevis]
MDNLIIEEGRSVGTLRIGMTKQELDQCVRTYQEKCIRPCDFFHSLFKYEYDSEGKVTHIHITDTVKDYYTCLFRDIDVFNTKASKLVEGLDKVSPYIRDNDASLGFSYTFPELGLSFWRNHVRNEEYFHSEEFKELDPDIQEDEMRYLYFETTTIFLISREENIEGTLGGSEA